LFNLLYNVSFPTLSFTPFTSNLCLVSLSLFTFFPSLFPIPFLYFLQLSFSISFLIISFFYFLSSSFFLASLPSLQYSGIQLHFSFCFFTYFPSPSSLSLFFKVPSIVFH
jgi:hypothetical protein